MDDLSRFTLAWAGLLTLFAIATVWRPVLRWLAAHLLARAVRALVRSPE